MKVSFLITFYNQREYVKKSIESILAIKKDYEWELLVGDDGSTDGTREVVQKYIRQFPENIFMYCRDRNDGIKQVVKRSSLNRINLINHMTGDYFCIIDGDDYYCCDDFIQKALYVYQENPDISVVAFGYQRVTNDDIVIEKNIINDEGEMNLKRYLMNYYTPAGACVLKNIFSNDVLAKVNKIGFYDDNDILMLNLNYGELYTIPNIIYAYRQNEISTYNSMSKFEQDVLNFQGWDVDRNYLTREKRMLLYRNIMPIISVLFRRRSIKDIDYEKLSEYYKESKSIPKSYTRLLLEYNKGLCQNNLKLYSIVIELAIIFPKKFINELIKLIINKLATLIRKSNR